MTVCSSKNVYKMFNRIGNHWFLLIAGNSAVALRKSRIHLSIKYKVPLLNDNTRVDIQQVIYSLDTGSLSNSVDKALNKEPLLMLPQFLAG